MSRKFIESVASTCNDPHLAQEAQRILDLMDATAPNSPALDIPDFGDKEPVLYPVAKALSLMLMAQGIAAPPSQPTRPPGPRTDERLDCDGSDCSCHGKDTIRDICRHCVRAEARDGLDVERPRVVCICGSTRFAAAMNVEAEQLTLAGAIVVRPEVVAYNRERDQQFVEPDVKAALDVLHLRKIDLADEVLVVTVDHYIGESTAREIAYARQTGKLVTFHEHPEVAAAYGGRDGLREALERLVNVALIEEEDQSPQTQDEWIAALKQATAALADARRQGAAEAVGLARFRRNVLIHDNEDATRFKGEWVAVPREDFEALRAALAPLERPRRPNPVAPSDY